MAVAVKNNPEVASASPFDRLPVVSLVGVVYVLGCLGIVFKLIPSVWWLIWPVASGGTGFVSSTLLGLVMLAAVIGLSVVGVRLLGTKAPVGVRAGIFVGLVGVLVILLLTRWASLWFEHWSFDRGWFGPSTGMALTVAVGVALLILGVQQFLRKSTERMLIRFEEQGWFYAAAYKPLQGLRVRRGTIFGLLLLVGAGIYTLISHGTLKKGAQDWQLNIPFTGSVVIDNPGDVGPFLPKNADGSYASVDRYTLQSIDNEHADPKKFVKIYLPNDADKYQVGDIVSREDFTAEVKRIKEKQGATPEEVPPQPATGPVRYEALTLLPSVQFTVPLLLLAGSLWLSWRIVNMPTFADFLIATEAELNKVSWTTQRRLIQDTIVVLATVVLFAGFLFAMDQIWRVTLSWKPIGVLQIPEDQSETNTGVEQKPW
jgi:preprotein translocase SecE subunit